MNQEKIGAFIAAMRKEKELTQEQLADRLRVNSRTVSRWETGRNMPDYAVLEPLTEELGITVNELIRGERIIKEDIVRAYDGNLVAVLKVFFDLDYTSYIPAGYLPEGFDATPGTPYRAAYLEAL